MRSRVFRTRYYTRKRVRGYAIIAFILCFLSGTIFKFRPILSAFAESEALWIATRLANETVAAVLSNNNEVCSQMILVNYTSSGLLSSVIPNSASINALRTTITDETMRRLESLDALTVSIPAGTLLGSDWLSGWGPMISFPISFTSTVLSDVTSSLEAVGMNQSTYRVLIHLDINLYVISPGGRTSVGTQLSFPMAEAVLLGEVPDNLTEVYGDDQSILGKIFDYGTAE